MSPAPFPNRRLTPFRSRTRPKPLIWASVLGAARSGTTFLRVALSAHPRCAILHEYKLTTLFERLEALVGKKAYVDEYQPEDISNLDLLKLELAMADGRMREAVNFYITAKRKWRPKVQTSALPLSVDAAARAFFEASFERRGLRVVGSKLPLGTGWSEDFSRLAAIPTMRFVLILRNPLDVVNSSLRRARNSAAGFDEWEIKTAEQASLEWIAANRQMADIFQTYPDRTIAIKYEDLVEDPSRVLAPMFSMLELKPISLDNSTIKVPPSLRGAFMESADQRFLQNRFLDIDRLWKGASAKDILQARLGLSDACTF